MRVPGRWGPWDGSLGGGVPWMGPFETLRGPLEGVPSEILRGPLETVLYETLRGPLERVPLERAIGAPWMGPSEKGPLMGP